MGCIRIVGGNRLSGSLRVQGSKNAALPMIAAAVLHNGKTVLHNCPRIADVQHMADILKALGAKVRWEENSLYMDCEHLGGECISSAYAKKLRASIIFLGALLGRCKKGAIAQPGGCVIGARPIDLHLEALKSLGVEIREADGILYADGSRMAGAEITFTKVSVGATQQAILAAVKAKGRTRICHCAKEPEIQWLIRYLNARGARIQKEGGEVLVIDGVERLEDLEFEVPPDRIAAGTYVCAAAITRSEITLENAPLEEMESFLQVYRKIGGQYRGNSGKLVADGRGVRNALPYLETAVYPGFPTDLQSPLMAVLCRAQGSSHIRETIFEDRFKVAKELRKMGAEIIIEGRDAWIRGVDALHGAQLEACELRGAAALVLAGLSAAGETVIENCEYVDRGYAQICEDFSALGGVINKDTGKNFHERFKLS